MRTVGVDPESALLRLPLTLRFADGMGLRWPNAPEPLDGGRHPARPRRWSGACPALLRAASAGGARFACATTRHRGHAVPRPAPRLMAEFVEPLCVAALNTPSTRPAAPCSCACCTTRCWVGAATRLLPPRRRAWARCSPSRRALARQRGAVAP
jgi:hypothetical protein